MARQEILTARCDRKECKTIVEIDRATEAPIGWLQVAVEVDGKFDTRARMEFCSEKCVSIWARNRGVMSFNGNGNGNGNGRNVREEVIAAIKALEDDGKWEWTVPEVAAVVQTHSTSVRKYFNKLVDEGKIEKRKGVGTKDDPIVYGRVTNTVL